MAISLFEHNERAYLAALNMLHEKGRAAVIHPTGTGKSFIAFKFCEEHADRTVCWISPSRYIFETQLENLRRVEPTCDPQNIRFFTYAKLANMTEAELRQIEPDCIILDEFHRCGAQMWGQGVERLRALYPQAMLLGLSATAIRYLDHQRDMADELFDRNIASEMTLGEAIALGVLHPPKYVTALYSYQKALTHYEKRVRNASNPSVRSEGERYLEALRRTMEKADGLDTIFQKHLPDPQGKYIVFCANLEHMQELVRNVPLWFSAIDPAAHVYTAYSDDPDTSEALRAFRKDTSAHLKLLFCIDMLNEGVHVENIAGVILFRPTVSPIVFKQQIGRALCAGKAHDTVILDIVNNVENLYSIGEVQDEIRQAVTFYQYLGEEQYIVNDRFDVIDEVRDCKRLFDALETVLSLSWEYMYQTAKVYFETHGNLLPLQSYQTKDGCKLGQWVAAQRQAHARKRLTAEQVALLESIGMSWLGLRERQWEEGYAAALEHVRLHHTLESAAANSRLGRWLAVQRQKYHRGTLPAEAFEKLSQLGMQWELSDVWQRRLDEAKTFYLQYGHLDIPANYITANGVRLGIWYRSVKNRYRENQLPQEKCRQLEAIGINWEPVKDRSWMKQYELAKAYYLRCGDLHVPKEYVAEDGSRLGIWIISQRGFYAKGTLSEERIALLEEIGMSWQRDIGRWETAFQYAQRYYDEYGHINASADYVTADDFALGSWIARQRRKYKEGKLKPGQITRLESLGMLWTPSEAFWCSAYEHAQDYYREFGHLTVAAKYISDDGFKLGSWLSNQKTRYRKGELNAQQIQQLEAIGMEFTKKKPA